MRLFLCEKPSQGRDIAKSLGATKRGNGYYEGAGSVVTWCIGHLVETAPPETYDEALKKWSLQALPIVPQEWKMVVKKSTASQFKVVKSLLSKATELIIATDADREGEMIARELVDLCNYRGPIKRLWLSALNDASIQKALSQLKPGHETESLYYSAVGRSRADWLIGMNLSRLFTLLGQRAGYQGVLSVGRVQTPTLKLVADRENQVKNFVPVPFWDLDVILQSESGGVVFAARWQCPEDLADEAGRCINQADAITAEQQIRNAAQTTVQQLKTERKKEQPPLPYELGELQKICSSKFGLGAQATLDTVQSLYETHKIVTYPRVDTGYLPENMHSEAPAILRAMLQSDAQLDHLMTLCNSELKSPAWNDAKVTAHHGIIPTAEVAELSKLSQAERGVYDLIKMRYLAQFFPPHEFDKTEAIFTAARYTLKAVGKKIVVPGWRITLLKNNENNDQNDDLANKDDDAGQELPQLTEGHACPVIDCRIDAKKTKAPALFTEGTLIEAMKQVSRYVTDPRLKAKLRETTGIGTNATRAGIIKSLLDRKLLLQKGKRHLIAASEAHDLLAAVPAAISNPGTTAIWEQALDMVESGELTLDDFVTKQSTWIAGIVNKYQQQPFNIKITVEKTPDCTLCGSPTRRRPGKNGDFFGCSKYPECKGIINIEPKKKSKQAYKKKD